MVERSIRCTGGLNASHLDARSRIRLHSSKFVQQVILELLVKQAFFKSLEAHFADFFDTGMVAKVFKRGYNDRSTHQEPLIVPKTQDKRQDLYETPSV